MKKILFDLEDIKPQLKSEQVKEIEHIIYMAKESKEPQQFQIGDYGKEIVVWPSGKLQTKTRVEENICPECNQPIPN